MPVTPRAAGGPAADGPRVERAAAAAHGRRAGGRRGGRAGAPARVLRHPGRRGARRRAWEPCPCDLGFLTPVSP